MTQSSQLTESRCRDGSPAVGSTPPPVAARAMAGLLRLYQLTLSPVLGSTCRFSPSCSEYMRQAMLRHGLWRGLGYGVRRLLRCHPYHPGGWDPVP